jgi:transcription elongation factor Elf1
MLRLANEIGCTQIQLSILQNKCFVRDHTITCPTCQDGKNILTGLTTPEGFKMRYKKGGWLCRDCGADLKAEIKNHLAACPNFST